MKTLQSYWILLVNKLELTNQSWRRKPYDFVDYKEKSHTSHQLHGMIDIWRIPSQAGLFYPRICADPLIKKYTGAAVTREIEIGPERRKKAAKIRRNFLRAPPGDLQCPMIYITMEQTRSAKWKIRDDYRSLADTSLRCARAPQLETVTQSPGLTRGWFSERVHRVKPLSLSLAMIMMMMMMTMREERNLGMRIPRSSPGMFGDLIDRERGRKWRWNACTRRLMTGRPLFRRVLQRFFAYFGRPRETLDLRRS